LRLHFAINYTNKIDFDKIFENILYMPLNIVLQIYFMISQSHLFTYGKSIFRVAHSFRFEIYSTIGALKVFFKDIAGVVFNLNFSEIFFLTNFRNVILTYCLFFKTTLFLIFGERTNFFFLSFYSLQLKNHNYLINFKLENFNNLFLTNYFSNQTNTFRNLLANEEASTNIRYLRFSNPSFKYDYKSGDYFPKLYKEIYTQLFSTYSDLFSISKSTPWFVSEKYKEILDLNFSPFVNNAFNILHRNTRFSHLNETFCYSSTDGFYNFFFKLSLDVNLETSGLK